MNYAISFWWGLRKLNYIGQIRNLARKVAQLYLEQREQLGFPLQKRLQTPAVG